MKSRDEIIALAKEALGLADVVEHELIPFEGRGSDRSYFRLRWNGKSAILVDYQPSRIENGYYAGIAGFLHGIGIPVPRIIRNDPQNCFIVMKDLGDVDLWCLRNESWELRRTLYRETLFILHRLHSFPHERFPSGQVKLMDPFGPELYRWERAYFKDNFVRAFCGIELDAGFSRQLEQELAALAESLGRSQRTLVHRDMQSQNVMISGGEPFLIDFQGMRFGTGFYDLGSLLCDPYVSFSDDQRYELLAYYHQISQDRLDWDSFKNAFWEASAQRLMQALGAYGFLGLTRGLKNYFAHIPAGLKNLQTATKHATTLPLLNELALRCREQIEGCTPHQCPPSSSAMQPSAL